MKKRALLPLILAVVVLAGISIKVVISQISATFESIPSKTCVVPTNTVATVSFRLSDVDHRMTLTNIEDSGGLWLVMVQSFDGLQYQSKDFFKPQTQFQTPFKIAGFTIKLGADRTFFIPYPADGTCTLEPLI